MGEVTFAECQHTACEILVPVKFQAESAFFCRHCSLPPGHTP